MKGKTILEIYEEKKEWIQGFNLTSDLFASKVFEDADACQELCRILLQDWSIILRDVRTQYVIRNLENHSMELDILAEQNDGDIVGIEIQMYEETAPFKRTRYYLSGIDMGILDKGKDYDELPDVTMVYITKKDIVGGGSGCYLVERKLIGRKADGQVKMADRSNGLKNSINISNGVKERYYNLRHPTGDEKTDELLAYFKDSDPYYKTETFPRIVERVRFFKIHKEGVDIMCEIADRIRNEGREEGRIEGRSEGRIESKIEDILELLEELGKVPQRIVELIRAEDNPGILSRWLKSAAKAGSITEFEANM